MKRHSLCILIALLILSGCKKADVHSDEPAAIQPQIIQVLERFTNKPIKDALVYLKKCSNYDFEFGCTGYSTHTVLTTNDSGKATYRGKEYIEATEVSHSDYWTNFSKRSAIITLTPKFAIEVSIKKVNNYPPGSYLWVAANTPNANFFTFNWTSFPLPVDTIIHLTGYGYADNEVSWLVNYSITAPLNSSASFYLSKPNTKVSIEY